MPDPRIRSPRLVVLMEKHPGSDELVEYTVQTDNRDMVRWDRYRASKNWPKADEAPMFWTTYMAFAAMRRGGWSGTYDEFEDVAVQVTAVDKDGNPLGQDAEGDAVDPTQ